MPSRKDIYLARVDMLDVEGEIDRNRVFVRLRMIVPRRTADELARSPVLPIQIERETNDNGDFV
jgi:hypothetical protein